MRHLVRLRLNERTVALPGPGAGGQWCAAGVDCTLAELRALAAAARARYNATCDLDLDEVLAAPPPSAALLAAAGRAATGLRDAGAMALGGVWAGARAAAQAATGLGSDGWLARQQAAAPAAELRR